MKKILLAFSISSQVLFAQNYEETADSYGANNVVTDEMTPTEGIISNAYDPETVDEASAEDTYEPDSANAVAEESNDGINPTLDASPEIGRIEEPNEFSGVPTAPGQMRVLAETEAPEEYSVEKGDSLFDICDQLLDEPYYWPKLWALNPYITNPHFIYPGMKLKFYPGDESNPPYLKVVTEEDIVPVNELPTENLVSEDVSSLLLNSDVPGATPVVGPQQVQEFPEINQNFMAIGSIYRSTQTKVILPAFYYSEEIPALGTVVAGETGEQLSDSKMNVIVSGTEISSGESYTVVRYVEDDESRRRTNSYRYEFVAQITVTGEVEDGLKKGRVLLSRLGVQAGDYLVSYKEVVKNVPIKEVKGGSGDGAKVVGFEYPFGQMGAAGDIVFLHGDSAPSEGSYIAIYQDLKDIVLSRNSDDIPHSQRYVGTAYAFASSDNTTAAYIVYTEDAIRLDNIAGKVDFSSQSDQSSSASNEASTQ